MKSLRITRIFVLLLLSAVACAQSDAQKSFDKLKALAGEWEDAVTADPRQPETPDGTRAHITMRVTSRGNALIHEMQAPGTPLDPTKYDHQVTMIYLNNGQLKLVHYCDAGNRPHTVATGPDRGSFLSRGHGSVLWLVWVDQQPKEQPPASAARFVNHH